MDEQELLKENRKLQDLLVAKEEESYITIANLKDENARLLRQIKQDKQGGSGANGGKNNANNERELAKLSVENEMLKKQIEELKQSRDSSMSSSNLYENKTTPTFAKATSSSNKAHEDANDNEVSSLK